MKERITPYLRTLIDAGSEAIKNQFVKIKDKTTRKKFPELDPLGEERTYSPVKGLVHKYNRVALIKTSDMCAAHCQFCTRYRDIGSGKGGLTRENILEIIDYIKNHTEISEVILSGGDPFFTPNITFTLLDLLEPIKSIKVIRIGTRLPVHAPDNFNNVRVQEVVEKIEKINRHTNPVHILIHFNHPDEITVGVERVLWMLRQRGIMLFSQTVFLKGVNYFENSNEEIKDADVFLSVDLLDKLFTKLHSLGVIPYYIYRCDYVSKLEHFVVPFEKEVKIMIELWKRLPGLALPQYIFDAPNGRGKIRVPLLPWKKRGIHSFSDIDGKIIKI